MKLLSHLKYLPNSMERAINLFIRWGFPDHGPLSSKNNTLVEPLDHLNWHKSRDTIGLGFYNVDEKHIFDVEHNDSN